MEHPFTGMHTESATAGNLQEFYSRIIEYYDELFPMNEQALPCVLRVCEQLKKETILSPPPIFRYLRVGCATGSLENRLATHNMDITGIDTNPDMVATAQRRIKASFSSIRFFEMNSLDMSRFLKSGSFNIIACIENTLPYIGDETLVRKFFHDAKKLLAPGGFLLVHVYNFGLHGTGRPVELPERSSIRVKLTRNLIPDESGTMILDAKLEFGNGQLLQLQKNTRILPLTETRLREYVREAGFSCINFYGDYDESPFTADSTHMVAVCRVQDQVY